MKWRWKPRRHGGNSRRTSSLQPTRSLRTCQLLPRKEVSEQLLIRDRNAQGLYDVLNQYEYGCTIDQARHDLQRALRFVDDMSYRYISNVIGDIRRRAKTGELDFTISPCKRGPNGDGLIFVVPKQEDGTFEV